MNRIEPMSDERFWQEAFLRLLPETILVAFHDADQAVEGYRTRYPEKPQAVAPAMPVWFSKVAEPPHEMLVEPEPQANQPPLSPPVMPQPERPTQDPRPWVCEGNPLDGELWHYFRDGHHKPAVCGHLPIPGTPYVSEVRPNATVCGGCDAAAVEPQPERTRLKWWREDGCWFAVTATRFHDWGIECTEQGQFVVTAGASGPIDPFPTLDEAKRRCQAEEDKLLAEQKGKSGTDDR